MPCAVRRPFRGPHPGGKRLKIKIIVWQLLRDRLPSSTEVAKRHGLGDGLCPLSVVPKSGLTFSFSFFLSLYLRDQMQASDLDEFLEGQTNHKEAPLMVSVCGDDLDPIDYT